MTELNAALLGHDAVPTSSASISSPYDDHSCACCEIAYFPTAHLWVVGHWIARPMKLLLLLVIFLIISGVALADFHNYHPSNLTVSWAVVAVYLFALLNVTISYCSLIIIGPGYLPFNFSVRQKFSRDLPWRDQLATFAVYDEQERFAKCNPRPPRACFSRTARRFILRADHFCIWTESWVGLDNHRYFILMTMWALLYVLIWYGLHYWWVLHFMPWHWTHLVSLCSGALLLPVLYLSTFYFAKGFWQLCKNITQIEEWKHSTDSRFDLGCFGNFAEVCGPKYCCCFWPCPFIPLWPMEDGRYSRFAEVDFPLETTVYQ
jgi:hypothetical protein